MNSDILSVALSIYGTKEAPGATDNPFILKMAADCGFKDYVHDSIAWCSLSANWVCLKAGYERSNSLAARSWLTVGQSVDEPQQGDVVVLWRDDPKGPFGHVAFYINRITPLVYLLGGNQADMYNIEGFTQDRVLGYRRPQKL